MTSAGVSSVGKSSGGMTSAGITGRRAWLAALAVAIVALPSCARVSLDRLERPGQVLAVLLPDSPDGAVGRASVSNAAGHVELDQARAATRVHANQAPSAVTVLSDADVQRLFGDALESLPPAPHTFTFHFQFESEELTAESRALLLETLQAVKRRPMPDVLVVGHTDTTGAAASNFELARRRAQAVRGLLVAAGLDGRDVAVASHGEAQPLVRTADGVYEPRNRRVHVTVR
jgi:OOP family OmpA-OmpF porin